MRFSINSSGAVSNVYFASWTTSPSNIYFDGNAGTSEASIGALTGNNEWYYDGSANIYVYSTTAPSGRVITPQLNTWQATVTTSPNIVNYNGSGNVFAKSSLASLASNTDWYWAANVLYVYTTYFLAAYSICG